MSQLEMFADAARDQPQLTDRQKYALDLLERNDGLPADELGDHMHSRKNKHHPGHRCQFCHAEGASVLHELRKKKLVIRRRSGMWESLRPRARPSAQTDAIPY